MSIRVKNIRNRLRVVLDSNILVSAIVFGGKPRKLLELLSQQIITVVIAEELLTETRRIFISKFPDFLEDLERVEKLLKRDGLLVRLGNINIIASRNTDDNKFIEAAVLGGCQYIVSGDKDLLVLCNYDDVQIVTVSNFLEMFTHSPPKTK